MKISTNTVNILKNFSKINPSIVVQEGNVLKTISPSKTIMARATVDTTFEKRFAIYDLNKLISALDLIDDPEVKIEDKTILIFSGNEKAQLALSDESNIVKAPDKEIALPSIDASFMLTNEHLKYVERAAGAFGLPEIVILGDGKNIFLQTEDSKNPSGNIFSINIGDTDKAFKAIFKSENIKIIPGDYNVTISSKGISHFLGKDVEYWIAVEQSSTF